MKKIFILITILFLSITGINAAEISTEAILQYNQGIDYYKTGRYDEAVSSFRTAIRLEPNYIDAYYNLGSVLEYLKQYDAALAVFKQIIVRKPDDYDSVYKAAWLSYKLGEYQKAKTYLNIIPGACPRAGEAQALLAQINMILPAKQAIATQPTTSSMKRTSNIYNNISAPTGITSDKDGNVYVAEFNNNAIIKITPDDRKILYVKDSKISGPIGLASDKSKNLYIANYNNNNILKVSSLGEISILISNVKKPYYLYVDEDILFISSQESNSVLKYKLH